MRVQAGVANLIFTVLAVAFFCTGDKNTQHAAIMDVSAIPNHRRRRFFASGLNYSRIGLFFQ